MKWMKSLLLLFALAAAMSAIAAAQEGYNGWQDRQWERDHDRWHREHDRDRDDRYRPGDRDYDDDDGYRVYGSDSRNPYLYQGIQEAQRYGSQYGLHDGQVDRQERRSYRARTNESYRKATFGYVKAYGDKDRYREVFRRAYERAYRRAYANGWYGQMQPGPWGR